MKQVIHIFGASGSGTSTLGKKICAETGYHFIDTDDYFWLPTEPKYTQKRPIDERLRLMRDNIASADNVVISGSLVDWGDEFIPLFTMAIRLETDTEIRIKRLKEREKASFGERIEVGGDMYQAHLNFLNWAEAYDHGGLEMRSKAKHDLWQTNLTCRLLVLDGNCDLEENFALIKEYL